MASTDVPVLIAGGGPVGMLLAVELGAKNTELLLVNDRPTTRVHPQAGTINSRTMEHMRRLGLSEAVRRDRPPAGPFGG